jgi:uncharacterized protein (TIGR03435 family)
MISVLLWVLMVPGRLEPVVSVGGGGMQVADLTAKGPGFAVASVRRDPEPPGSYLRFTVDGFSAAGVPLRELIQEAYGLYGDDRFTGEAPWVDTELFAVEAKIDDAAVKSFADVSLQQRRLMLQALLKDRFGVVVHRAKVERPVYELVIAKGGSKLQASKPEETSGSEIKGRRGFVKGLNRGLMTVEGFSMDDLAELLENDSLVDRPVVNRTALAGYFDFSFHWIPADRASETGDGQRGSVPADPGTSSTIFTEIQKQLGLRLQPSKGLVDILVVDHAEAPTAN